MTMKHTLIARILLGLGALSALGFGAFGLANPAGTAETVALEPLSPFGTSEIRAIYGGLWLAMGLVLSQAWGQLKAGGWSSNAARERVRALAWSWLGLPIARSFSLLVSGSEGGPAWTFVAAEIAMVACLAGSLALAPRRSGP